ncbi:MAG TPA: 2Fe-2S iron-sulfur cluster binding domain-containing protein [Aromatoleum sp.]|uniref:2Fe-2S iron-sulfur cluster binding domain-containing protein n=1 Tax=Aromatoleum sp. TaxID=2307007 RepID=UPI002B47601D|nr:2Fe-2S iron-sulfur cluster binding domain-containing protein [Aromatoleum sp.]HJV25972.1 2Fe-2S iron-sulfur cluster binding domain-containing protein [Aromatoleum sp.]
MMNSEAEKTAVCEVEVNTATVRFADGVEHQFPVRRDQTILAAAKENDVRLVHQCLTGSCGTCVTRVASGAVRMSTARGTSLLPSEAAEGYRLTCTSFCDSDAVLQFDYPSSVLDEPGPVRCSARVAEVTWVASNVVRLSLRLPEDAGMDFRSGQYVRVRVPGTEDWRSYSMASTAADLPELVLLLRVLDAGVMSDYLRSRARAGDAVEIEGPFGMFHLRESKGHHIMIAGGTGLAPMLGMLEDIRMRSGRKPKVLLSFGCASEDNLFYLDELDVRAAWLPGLKLKVAVANPGPDYKGLVGNPVEVITATDLSDPATAVAYLCGPPPMIESARAHLERLGVPAENIYAEHFSASAA